ncbi:aldo/keto reductase [bacterium]|nr:aldo/keto reductase [bacterium]MBU1435446.1 aldo/keto reductase [bacterium]MBU1502630.1 aldo/keto reductase [bacterium]
MSLKIPKIIYGTAWKKDATAELVVQAVEAGFRAIDTACQPKHYFEGGVGEALALLEAKGIKRSSLFVQTKFTPLAGHDILTTPYDKYAPLEKQVAESFEISKKNLQTDYVDSLVLHSPPFPSTLLMRVWKSMEAIQKRGEALRIGISNCYDLAVLKKLYEEAEIKPWVVQNRFYADTDYDKEIRKWCKEKKIAYQSFWSLSANPHLLASETVVKIAKKYKKSEAQILFNFLSHEGITPLSGTTSPEHMQDDVSAFDFTLTANEYEAINELL